MARIAGNSKNNTLRGTTRNDVLLGLGGNDTLSGLAGSDRLDGGPGVDRMAGGLGNDTYVVDNFRDQVIERPREGIDLVKSSVSWRLGTNVERLTLIGDRAINGTGNSLNNRIQGNSKNNVLNGAIGNDTLLGASGNDTLIGGSGNNTLSGGTGRDTASYASENYRIYANLTTGTTQRIATILPLGDSITAGDHNNAVPGAYRVSLFNNLRGNGYRVDFVGSKRNGPTSSFDRDHEGNPGKRISEITNVVDGPDYLKTYRPDIVLVMAGTNDTNATNNRTLDQMKADLGTLIDEITARRPNARIVISSVPPVKSPQSSTRNNRLQAFNQAIPDVVSAKVAQGKRVTFVNAGGSLSAGDIGSDGIHPTQAGYNELGDTWYNRLSGTRVLSKFREKDTLISIENLTGSRQDDELIGNNQSNILRGGFGRDRLTGNGGNDSFAYRSRLEGRDTITDFNSGDSLRISAAGFGGGLRAGVSLRSTASRTGTFVSSNNPTSLGSGANFLYNTNTGLLSFDRDGTGSSSAFAVATLAGSPTLSRNQFTIVA